MTSNHPPTSDPCPTKLQRSRVRSPTLAQRSFGSDLRSPTSDFGPRPSDFGPRSSTRSGARIALLAAMARGLTVEELCTIYRIQFPVLRQHENDTWYDRNGRIVFTCSKGLPGVGFSRPKWNEFKDMKSGTVSRTITDDTLPSGPRERTIIYTAPFDRCDREADYATAWAEFERRLGPRGDKTTPGGKG